MKLILNLFILIMPFSLCSQNIVDFESFGLNPGMFLDGSTVDGVFETNEVSLNNTYSDAYGYIGGWAISSMTDTLTPGFGNQFSVSNGMGYDESNSYAVAYSFDPVKITFNTDYQGRTPKGVYVNNNTFAYLSMRDGDGFAKQFGGLTGTDPDFFLLKVNAYFQGLYKTEEVSVYLADFRSDDSSEDFIINDWTWLDLNDLGPVDSLEFSLSSSDVGQFGMNTPAYFCIDQFEFNEPSAINTKAFDNIKVFPNPTADFLTLNSIEFKNPKVKLLNLNGRLQKFKFIETGNEIIIDLRNLNPGSYILIVMENGIRLSRMVNKY